MPITNGLHSYFAYWKEARRYSEVTVDATAKALDVLSVTQIIASSEPSTGNSPLRSRGILPSKEFKEIRRKTKQKGDSKRDTRPTETLLPVACTATWLQVSHSVFRCRLLQSFGERSAHCHSPAGAEKAPTLEKPRESDDASQHRC